MIYKTCTSDASNEPGQPPCSFCHEVQVVDPSKIYDGLEKAYHFAPIGPSRSATEVTPFLREVAPGRRDPPGPTGSPVEQIDDDLKEIFMLGRKRCASSDLQISPVGPPTSPEVARPCGAVGRRVTWQLRENSKMTPMLNEIWWNGLDSWWIWWHPYIHTYIVYIHINVHHVLIYIYIYK